MSTKPDIMDRLEAMKSGVFDIETLEDARSEIAHHRLNAESAAAQSDHEISELREQIKTLARVEKHLRELVTEIGGKIAAWKNAMHRDAWQEGLTLAEATEQMLHASENCKHAITVEHADNQLKFAARKAIDAMNERDEARKAMLAAVVLGHDNDCLFCGFKDKKLLEALPADMAALALQRAGAEESIAPAYRGSGPNNTPLAGGA